MQDDFIVTATGRRFYFHGHKPEDICLEDIAISLSRLCRYTGHCRRHYSVLEHSINVARQVEIDPSASPADTRGRKLSALLHDAAEAYVGDLNGPLKHMDFMEPYRKLENKIQKSIGIRFGILYPFDHEVIYIADRRMRHTEKRDLMPVCTDCPDMKWKDEAKYPPFADMDLRRAAPSASDWQHFVQMAQWYGAKA